MTMPELPANASRREMRKTLLRMRLEMHRQELRHETLVMLQPLRQAQQLKRYWRDELNGGSAPVWVASGALLLATLGLGKGHWRRWLRIALIAFPLLRRNPPRQASDPTKDVSSGD
jgi:hypothetical protein